MTYCYIRKSTDKQFYLRQFDVLKNKGYVDGINCTYVEETYTGTKKDRPIFDKLLDNLSVNDTIIVESLSRLSRGGLYQTVEIIKHLIEKKKVSVIILKENLELKAGENINAITNMFLGICSVLAQFERDLLSERTKEGLQARKSEGIKMGRPTKKDISMNNFINVLQEHIDNKTCYKKATFKFRYPESTFYYYLKEYREKYNINDDVELLNYLKRL